MITIRRGRDETRHIWTVGCYEPETENFEAIWTPLRNCKSAEQAMEWLSYLNGGEHPKKLWPPETI